MADDGIVKIGRAPEPSPIDSFMRLLTRVHPGAGADFQYLENRGPMERGQGGYGVQFDLNPNWANDFAGIGQQGNQGNLLMQILSALIGQQQ
jgi:hypothetical protein